MRSTAFALALCIAAIAASAGTAPAQSQDGDRFQFRSRSQVIEFRGPTESPVNPVDPDDEDGDGDPTDPGGEDTGSGPGEGKDTTPPAWDTSTLLPIGESGQPYTASVSATDDRGSVTYSKWSWAPSWVAVDPATGHLAGTPTARGTYNLTLRATDPSGNYADHVFTIVIENPFTAFEMLTGGAVGPCGIKGNAEAWCWGRNNDGRLGGAGIGTMPVRAGLPSDYFADIATAARHTCGIKMNGEAWCWGSREFGRLGNGGSYDANTNSKSESPVMVSTGVYEAIALSNDASCGLTTTGRIWCWGRAGMVGDGTTSDRFSPVEVSGGHNFIKLFAGIDHMCGLKANGEAWCWGTGGSGRLGNGSTSNQTAPVRVEDADGAPHHFVSMSLGNTHSCGVKSDGGGWCWGSPADGRLGDGTTSGNKTRPVFIGNGHVHLAAGYNSTCSLKTDGKTLCWGSNAEGQLGNGTSVSSTVPVEVVNSTELSFVSIIARNEYACGLTGGGVAWCWGRGTDGRLGNGSSESRNVPVPVSN